MAVQVSLFVEIVTVCSLASFAKVKLSVERSRVASSTSLCPWQEGRSKRSARAPSRFSRCFISEIDSGKSAGG